ncbi:galactosyltransferase-domain-containing protein [Haematococcus lacustris]
MRRAALRSSWFPAGPHQRRQLRAQLGIALRFVVGVVAEPGAEAQLAAEQVLYGDILRLPDIKEGYHGLAAKTRAFFALVAALYPAAPAASPGPRWVVKVDDDVWLSPARLRAASLQWSRMAAGYVGCMKHGVVWTEQQSRWGEPQHLLLGPRYFIHAYGSAYAVAGQVVREVLGPAAASLRLLANEDTSVGAWMLAHNVKHFEDMRLCAQACHPAAVAVGRPECAGLCDPVNDLVAAQNNTDCTSWGRWDHVQLQLPNGTRLTSRLKKERAGFVTVAAPSNVTGPVWEWWPMTQIVPGELPYLAPYPEHTAFSSMWV